MERSNMDPLFYAKEACDTLMRMYHGADLPPKGHFHYHQGVFLSGVYQTYLLTKEETYFEYMKTWVDSIISEDGTIGKYDSGQLDDIQPGILLFPLWKRTHDIRYQKALDRLMQDIECFPRNEEGGFWHKAHLPGQMWLDGLYMGGPICSEYADCFDKPEYLELAVQQILLMREHTIDSKTGLWYHAWEGSGQVSWADPETGLSPEFWGRSIGWVPVAVLDVMEYMPESHPQYKNLCKLVKELLEAVCRFQSEEGRWYQVVDKGGQEGNWLENSCSSLFVAAICKAIKKGILDPAYVKNATKGYEGVIKDLHWKGEDLLIGNVCIGTGVGDYKHYCDRPVCTNDLHGVGAFLLMCTQMYRLTTTPGTDDTKMI